VDGQTINQHFLHVFFRTLTILATSLWPHTAHNSAMLQPLIPQPLAHEAEIHEHVVGTNRNLPCRLMREQRPKQVAAVSKTPLNKKEY